MPRKSRKKIEEERLASEASAAAGAESEVDDLAPASESAEVGDIVDDKGGQQRIPTMERRGNKAIEKAMEQVKKYEVERMEAAKREKEAREFLIGLMEREQVATYEFDGMRATLNNNKKVSVKVAKDDLEGADEEDWEPPSETAEDVDAELAQGPQDSESEGDE